MFFFLILKKDIYLKSKWQRELAAADRLRRWPGARSSSGSPRSVPGPKHWATLCCFPRLSAGSRVVNRAAGMDQRSDAAPWRGRLVRPHHNAGRGCVLSLVSLHQSCRRSSDGRGRLLPVARTRHLERKLCCGGRAPQGRKHTGSPSAGLCPLGACVSCMTCVRTSSSR